MPCSRVVAIPSICPSRAPEKAFEKVLAGLGTRSRLVPLIALRTCHRCVERVEVLVTRTGSPVRGTLAPAHTGRGLIAEDGVAATFRVADDPTGTGRTADVPGGRQAAIVLRRSCVVEPLGEPDEVQWAGDIRKRFETWRASRDRHYSEAVRNLAQRRIRLPGTLVGRHLSH